MKPSLIIIFSFLTAATLLVPACEKNPSNVEIPLSQHIGSPAQPLVQVGDNVRKGQCIGEIPEGKLGARVHASIDGIVKSVGQTIVIESI